MIRRRVPVSPKDRPWLITLTARGVVLTPKRELAFVDADAGKWYADTLWRGVDVALKHRDSGETWTRDHLGAWSHTPPAPPPPVERTPQWWERD